MSKGQLFKLHPLSRALKIFSVAPLLLFCDLGYARVLVPGEILAIDANTKQDNYVLNGASTLNANGALTRQIVVNNSTLNMQGSTVQATGATGVLLNAGRADISANTHITSDRNGLAVSRNATATQGSTAIVSDSFINGGTSGATITGLSNLTLLRTEVTGAKAMGLNIFGGTITATDSTITGNASGIEINSDPLVNAPATLTLNHSKVEGRNGPAILIDTLEVGPVQANISVLNGTTLTAGNGTLMDVRNGAEGNLRVGSSTLVGDIVADGNSTANVQLEDSATLTGRLQNVQNLGINSNARWVMVGDGEVQNLIMNGGGIQFGNPGEFFKLNVETLSGTGGTFFMHTDFQTGQVDTLTVAGAATGNHTVAIDSSGSEPRGAGAIPVVHIGSGDATFSLAGGAVDLGAFSYDLIQHGSNDWYLDTASRVISPGTQSVIALFNAAPTAWYGELSTLRSRMGEVRMDHGKAGGWIRAYGNKFDVNASSGVAYQQVQQGLSFGADAPLQMGDGQWLVGVLGGYSKSDLDLSRGTSGTIDSYSLGAYTTWLDEPTGYYFDGVLKFNRFQNESDVQLSDGKKTKGNYDSNGVGASLEFGRHIKLADDYFVEPFTQLSGVIIQGEDYDLDNGLSAEGSRTHSLLAKAGATAGRNFKWDDKVVQPYIRAAYVHEFANNNEVKVNDNTFNNNLSGSRGELGAGVAMTLTDKVSIHADFDYSNGDKIEQPWGANFGLRYLW
ncbi:autotransporter outer membrane beta-barrel domain-containing protein [Pseudomonas umsongensis]|uniref:autotransporter outer membrane beta-barrel domain-containing protein n=1 Tax=Pseudomonas umsongensis TaxID=198618 RepID=UPI00200B5132|nr:autotransporter outer membrane beta-barrel domain-containing protein [Pseudomonas umsongensis]MCK8655613.1 autotransporter outer membrane beta-barrel domain-containing protein [Pseudomonas umsongensis]